MKTDWWAITIYFGYGTAIGTALADFNWIAAFAFLLSLWWFFVVRRQQKVINEIHDGLQAMKSGLNHEIGEI
jgi:hypothetical protein